jgi:hypothetical protein
MCYKTILYRDQESKISRVVNILYFDKQQVFMDECFDVEKIIFKYENLVIISLMKP